jgi:hypothetical protein
VRWVAHHEAAHTVACLRLRPDAVHAVTIVASGSTLGQVYGEHPLGSGRYDEHTGMWVPDVQVVEAAIIELLAGYFGAVRSGCPPASAKRHSSDDDEQVADLLGYTRETRRTFRGKADRFVEHEWQAILAVAQELLQHETLDDVEVELIADVSRLQEARADLMKYSKSRPHRPT